MGVGLHPLESGLILCSVFFFFFFVMNASVSLRSENFKVTSFDMPGKENEKGKSKENENEENPSSASKKRSFSEMNTEVGVNKAASKSRNQLACIFIENIIENDFVS
ncbi:hypothetical protein PVL29_027323 [Vitis rotundifolia]|uniref:Uncharacterized protein n=1 Tax=Vitis rotundifolia TaxID=103349 RepID=A0AA38YIY2_VITRO|nr:hypothetical protein PVL29_027323 [Vitis rotundifolia]